MKKYIPLIVFALLTVAILAFIFGMSLKSIEESGEMSSGLVAKIKPLLDPKNKIPLDKFHYYVRKIAHFTEFAALGACLCGLYYCIGQICKTKLITLPVFSVLLSAVTDEFVQYFTGRGSMVTDVVLDFCGGLFGLFIGICAVFIVSKVKKRHKA